VQLAIDVFGSVAEHGGGGGRPEKSQENCGGLRLVRDIEMQDSVATSLFRSGLVVW